MQWGIREGLSMLISESAGLCNRCSPHIKGVTSVCVVDNLSGVHTPRKIGPMLKSADIVAITKGDIVSQAEREVFAFRTQQVNPKGRILNVNGITGQGAYELATLFAQSPDISTVQGCSLRFSMPSALCSYCLGEPNRRVVPDGQREKDGEPGSVAGSSRASPCKCNNSELNFRAPETAGCLR